MAFGGKSKQQGDTSTQNGHLPEADEEAGFVMGSGRGGRVRDGAGTYEMAGMAPREEG